MSVVSIISSSLGSSKYGTGFYIKKNLILTCHHLIKNSLHVFIYFNDSSILRRCLIYKILPDCDLALLYDFQGNNSFLELASSFSKDEHISIIGRNNFYNQILEINGNILYENYVLYPNISFKHGCIDSIATDIHISKGFSGSPILQNNYVIGIITWFSNENSSLYLSGGPNSLILHNFIHNSLEFNKPFDIIGLSLHECINHNIYESYGEKIISNVKHPDFLLNDIIIKIDNQFIGYDRKSSTSFFLENFEQDSFKVLIIRNRSYLTLFINNPWKVI